MATLIGTDGGDVLTGVAGESNVINGGAGNDVLTGADGNDVLDGGPGNDTLDGRSGDDILHGGDGYDTLYAGPGVDWLDGGAGDDTFIVNGPADVSPGDRFSGGDGYDTLLLNSGTLDFRQATLDADFEVVRTGSSVTAIMTYAQFNSFPHISGYFQISGSGTFDLTGNRFTNGSIVFDAGDDTVNLAGNTAEGFSAFNLGGGDDHFIGSRQDEAVHGGAGNDLIEGGDGNDSLWGDAGNDVLLGGAGIDTLYDGPGADDLEGGDGDDRIVLDLTAGTDPGDRFSGGAGNDTLVLMTATGAAVDFAKVPHLDDFERIEALSASLTIDGATYAHFLSVRTQSLTLTGGATFVYTPYAFEATTITLGDQASRVDFTALPSYLGTGVVINGGAAADTIVASALDDRIAGGGGDDRITAGAGADKVDGGNGNDTIDGGAGNDVLSGAAGNDTIDGGSGGDTIDGGDGDDVLIGGVGADIIDGGAGADRIVYRAAGESTLSQTDYLRNFQHGTDRIDLSAIPVSAVTFADNHDGTTMATVTTGTAVTMVLRIDGVATLADFILPAALVPVPVTSAPTLPGPGALAQPPKSVGPTNLFTSNYDRGNYTIAAGDYIAGVDVGGVFNYNRDTLTNRGGLYLDMQTGYDSARLGPFGVISTLVNSGIISFTSSNVIGFVNVLDEFHSVTNTGSIYAVSTTTGPSAYATASVRVFNSYLNPTIVNSGLIAAYSASGNSMAIGMPNGGHITNTAAGIILAEGFYASAIQVQLGTADGGWDVDNAGLIVGRSVPGGPAAYGLLLGFARINNSGTITADIAFGGQAVMLVNSGTVSGIAAIDVSDFFTVTNTASGQIFGAVHGGTGADTLTNQGLVDGDLWLDAGNDVVVNSGNGRITGVVDLGLGDDRYTGSNQNDRVTGDNGDDTIDGADGNDLLMGGNGNDRLTGGLGNDGLYGEAGNDTLLTSGADVAWGGKGDDRIELGDYAFASVIGGTGVDTLVLPTGSRVVDLSAVVASGRAQGFEIVELRDGQRLVVRSGDVAGLSDTADLRVDGTTTDGVALVGAWTAVADVMIGGHLYHRWTLGGDTITVGGEVAVTVGTTAPAGAGGLDAVADGPAALAPGPRSGVDFTSDVLAVLNYELRESVTIAADETWFTLGKYPAVYSYVDGVRLQIDGQLLATNADQATAIAIDFHNATYVINSGYVLAEGDGALEHPQPSYFPYGQEGATAIVGAVSLDNSGTVEAYSVKGVATALGTMRISPGYLPGETPTPDTYLTHDAVPLVTNTGTILATSEKSFAATMSEIVHLTNSGMIWARGATGALGMIAIGTVTNLAGGTIRAESPVRSTAILVRNGGEDGVRIDNAGVIAAQVAIDADSTETQDYARVILTNSGSIQGMVRLSLAGDTVYNNGTIVGEVHLRDGNDRFDSHAGTSAVTVFGEAGDDVLIGGSGDDRLSGGEGNNTLDGGLGVDTAIFDDVRAHYAIASDGHGGMIVSHAGGGTDRLSNVERLQFADQVYRVPRTGLDLNGDGSGDVLFHSSSGVLASWQVAGDAVAAGGGNIGNPGSAYRLVGTGDFDGDGKSDLLFRGRDGTLASWQVSGTTIVGGGNIGNPGSAYVLVGTGDLNGDGKSDMLFLNALTGAYASWDLNGTAIVGGGTIGNPGNAYVFKGLGDFDGDGKSDILFQNVNGSYATWTLGDTAITGGANLGNPGPGWFFKGLGDFNGDGRTDVLFENGDGTYATWDVGGNAVIGGGTIGNPGSAWSLAGIADYNGDGMSDLLFRNASDALGTWTLADTTITGGATLGNPGATYSVVSGHGVNAFATLVFQNTNGAVATWEINAATTGAANVGGATLGSPGAGWSAKAVGDFSGTGETDILFQNSDGTLATWRCDGTHLTGGGTLGNAGSAYAFKGIGDFNGDGKSDIVFLNTSTGAYSTWDVSGTQIIGGGTLGVASGYTFVGTGDLDGDGKADIVFKDASGSYAAWFVSDTNIVGGGTIGNPGVGWNFKALADLNGDGHADFLFQNTTTGDYASWDLDGTRIIGGGTIGNPGGTFSLAKIADINADGKADLVFEDASGNYAAWLIDDTRILQGANLGNASMDFHLI